MDFRRVLFLSLTFYLTTRKENLVVRKLHNCVCFRNTSFNYIQLFGCEMIINALCHHPHRVSRYLTRFNHASATRCHSINYRKQRNLSLMTLCVFFFHYLFIKKVVCLKINLNYYKLAHANFSYSNGFNIKHFTQSIQTNQFLCHFFISEERRMG